MRRKLFFALFILCFQVISAWCEEIVIASWNIRHPGEYQKEFLAEAGLMVSKNDIDILALQEVNPYWGKFTDAIRDALEQATDVKWGYFSSDVNQHIKDAAVGKEYYNSFRYDQTNVIFYRTDRFTGSNRYKDYSFHKFYECDYKVDKNSLLVVSLREIQTGINFNLVNIHLPAGNSEHRYRDFDTVQSLFDSLPDRNGKIMMGDFNLNYNEVYGHFPYVGVKEPTTLRTKGGFANDYDHFAYNKAVNSHIVMRPARVKKGGKYVIGAPDFKEMISDHAPVIMSVDFSK